MSRLTRWVQRLLFLIVAIATAWLIATQLFDRMDRQLPLFIALIATYLASAYLILPLVIQATLAVTRRNHIPQLTRAGDGWPADPVNIVLAGTLTQLRDTFHRAGWVQADPLGPCTGWRMIESFIAKRPYPAAPFSALYLFGRAQDIGFQEDIGDNPRQRHHVRFWAADIDPTDGSLAKAYWWRRTRIDPARAHVFVGAGTRDIGFGLQSLTFQISHRVDRNADAERDHILECLAATGMIAGACLVDPGNRVETRFVTDGRIVHARLLPDAAPPPPAGGSHRPDGPRG